MYIKFCLFYAVNYIHPKIVDILMYIQFLVNTLSSPTSIKNYLSGARGWVLRHNGLSSNFEAIKVKEMLSAVENTLTHVPNPAAIFWMLILMFP